MNFISRLSLTMLLLLITSKVFEGDMVMFWVCAILNGVTYSAGLSFDKEKKEE